jgi:dynein heavy chain, axonemal
MVGEDRLLFEGVISDLFPGEVTPETDYKDLMECIGIKLKEMNLQSTEYLIRKII